MAQAGEGLLVATAMTRPRRPATAPRQRRTSLAPGGVLYTQREVKWPFPRALPWAGLFPPSRRKRVAGSNPARRADTNQGNALGRPRRNMSGPSPRARYPVPDPTAATDGLADQEKAMRKTWIALLALASATVASRAQGPATAPPCTPAAPPAAAPL